MSDALLTSANTLSFQGRMFRCATGKNGFSPAEGRKEGSNTTPTGRFALRECWYRADKIAPPHTILPMRVTREEDGWCDDAAHSQYNRQIKLPFAASHEKLWRQDALYDIVIPLGFNDAPVVAGRGSAIFMHIARPDYSGTEGCIALALEDMLDFLSMITVDTHISVPPIAT